MRKPKAAEKGGFTLVELIVVLVILAILAGLLVPALTGYIQNAREKVCLVQRSTLTRYFKAAYAYEEDLRSCTSQQGVDALVGGNQKIGSYLSGKGYCDEGETVCPVHQVPYGFAFVVRDGVMQIEFLCPCVKDPISGIIEKANQVLETLPPNSDRQKLIEEYYKANGNTLPQVDAVFTQGTVFAGETLYWRPYNLKDGTMVLFASPNNTSGHDGWKGSLIYINGQIYESTAVHSHTGDPQGTSVASLQNASAADFGTWAGSNKFKAKA